MGDSEITSARNYAKGAAGRFPGIDALPLTGQYTTYSLRPRARASPTTCPTPRPPARRGRPAPRPTTTRSRSTSHGEPQQTLLELAKAKRAQDRRRHHRRDPGRHPGRAGLAHLGALLLRPGHRPPPPAPRPRWRTAASARSPSSCSTPAPTSPSAAARATFAETATAGDVRRPDPDRSRPTAARLPDGQPTRPTSTRSPSPTRRSRCSACSPPATCRCATSAPPRPSAATQPAAAPPTCTANPTARRPSRTLADMTTKAIALLDNPEGFFLQVEGASIDKQDHAADACGQIGETVDLDEAVQVALAFAKTRRQHLGLRHRRPRAHQPDRRGRARRQHHARQDGHARPRPTAPRWRSATPPRPARSQQHTGTQLRIAGYGPQAANIVGLTDQTDLFFTIATRCSARHRQPTPDHAATPRAAQRARPRSRCVPGTVRRASKVSPSARGFRADRPGQGRHQGRAARP